MPVIKDYDNVPLNIPRKSRRLWLICAGCAGCVLIALSIYYWHRNSNPGEIKQETQVHKTTPDGWLPGSLNQYASRVGPERQGGRPEQGTAEPTGTNQAASPQRSTPNKGTQTEAQQAEAKNEKPVKQKSKPLKTGSSFTTNSSQPEAPVSQSEPQIAVEEPSRTTGTQRVTPQTNGSTQSKPGLTEKQMLEQKAAKFESRRKWAEASGVLAKLVQMDPGNIDIRRRYGLALARAGLYRRAVPELEAVALNGKANAVTWDYLGYIYGIAGRYQHSFETSRQAVELQPGDYWHYEDGAHFIAETALHRPRFRSLLPLAWKWYFRAQQLGASERELRPIRLLLGFEARIWQRPRYTRTIPPRFQAVPFTWGYRVAPGPYPSTWRYGAPPRPYPVYRQMPNFTNGY